MEHVDIEFDPPTIECPQGIEIPVFIVSLPSAKERREKLIERGLPREWVSRYFPATDMRHATSDQINALADIPGISHTMGREIKGGEVGCSLSHRAIAVWLSNSKYEIALVLEDDIIPQGCKWKDKISATAQTLSVHAKRGAAFICLLGLAPFVADRVSKRKVRWIGRELSENLADVYLYADQGSLWRSHAYLISVEAARRSSGSEKSSILTVADHWSERKRRGWIDEIMFTQPPLMEQDTEIVSGIGLRKYADQKNNSKNYAFRIKSFIRIGHLKRLINFYRDYIINID